MNKEPLYYSFFETPIGDMVIGSYEDKIYLLDWQNSRHRLRNDNRIKKELETEFITSENEFHIKIKDNLNNYFKGEIPNIDIPYQLVGTSFQKRVWKALLNVKSGQTVSYENIAKQIGKPNAVRAVANAVGANSLSILIPCHRIIGKNGSLTGYAGGLHAKKYLLSLEAKH